MVRYISSRSKGQAFAPDFLASIVVFGFMLSIFLVTWNSIVDSQLSNQRDRELYVQGERSVKKMISHEGDPENWNSGDVEVLGFADEPHILNQSKLQEFEQLTLSEQNSLLKSQNFNLRIVENGENLYEIGSNPESNQIFVFDRDVLLNDSGDLRRVEVRYSTWS